MYGSRLCLILFVVVLPRGFVTAADDVDLREIGKSLTFHASFDRSANADFALGDRQVHTAKSLARKSLKAGVLPKHVATVAGKGKWGGALAFTGTGPEVVLFRGKGNVAYTADRFQGTVSFWMSLDPDKDLPPGYCDPLQITDKTWNDASLFIDFTKDDNPRHMRLGVFSDLKYWNPTEKPWESIAVKDRPMVDVAKPPFGRGKWTHVALTYGPYGKNSSQGKSVLYVNGQRQGDIAGRQRFTWQMDKTFIMLGIGYVGLIDDLALFGRSLSASEIAQVYRLNGGVVRLGRAK